MILPRIQTLQESRGHVRQPVSEAGAHRRSDDQTTSGGHWLKPFGGRRTIKQNKRALGKPSASEAFGFACPVLSRLFVPIARRVLDGFYFPPSDHRKRHGAGAAAVQYAEPGRLYQSGRTGHSDRDRDGRSGCQTRPGATTAPGWSGLAKWRTGRRLDINSESGGVTSSGSGKKSCYCHLWKDSTSLYYFTPEQHPDLASGRASEGRLRAHLRRPR